MYYKELLPRDSLSSILLPLYGLVIETKCEWIGYLFYS